MTNEHHGSSFDDRAKDWDDQPGRREHAQRVADTVARALAGTPVQDALEVGAGTGLLAVSIAQALGDPPPHFTLADTSAGMRDVAQARIVAANLPWDVIDADLSTGAGPESAYDLVVTHMVLHHVADVAALLAAVRRALRPGGTFVALDLTDENEGFHDVAPEHRPGEGDPHYHHDGFGEAELRRRCADAGFASVDHSVPLTITRNRDGIDREFPLFLLVAR